MRVWLFKKETGSFSTGAGETEATITMSDTMIKSGDGITDVHVWIKPSGGEWSKATIESVDYANKKITLSGLTESTSYEYEAFYLGSDDLIRVLAGSPGSDLATGKKYELGSGRIDEFHASKQYNPKQVFRLGGFYLPEDFKIFVTCKALSKSEVWKGTDGNYLSKFVIEIEDLALEELSEADRKALAEVYSILA